MARILGVIPARGGSKKLPRKNLRTLHGKPLIAHSIEQANGASLITRSLVSTDDPEIAEVAKFWGGEIPFLRPADLGADDTPMVPVIQHALAYAEEEEEDQYEAVVILQPTTPLRLPEDIDRVVELLLESAADTVVTICAVDKLSHPLLAQHLDPNDRTRLRPFSGSTSVYKKLSHAGREQLPEVVRLNGAVYGVRRAALLDKCRIIGDEVRGVWMEKSRSIDIDDEDDLRIAAALMLTRKET